MPEKKKPTMFPRDCPRDCPHFRAWDMSIDNWTCVCDLLHCQYDECDTGFQQVRCPLDDASDRLGKICANHGLTPDGVEFALEQYQKVICEITHGMLSKLTYEADHVLEVAQERWCNTCELKEAKEARVLAVNEVRAHIGEVLWMEVEPDEDGHMISMTPVALDDIRTDMNDDYEEDEYLVFSDGFDPASQYGHWYRLWTARPTEEQRKAVEWDA